jgi:hypothetical protein
MVLPGAITAPIQGNSMNANHLANLAGVYNVGASQGIAPRIVATPATAIKRMRSLTATQRTECMLAYCAQPDPLYNEAETVAAMAAFRAEEC